MSVQFGRWNFDGQPLTPIFWEKVSAALAPYGPDSNESYSKGGIRILYRAFHTTKESHREKQPCICQSGAIVTWDGRLDNRAELIRELRGSLTSVSTDVAVVAATYDKWGVTCLAKLVGDWAISIWNPIQRSLILARDPMGPRHLYYSFDDKQVTWCTVIDPLVLFAGRALALCEEYIAGWLGVTFPSADLTPYVGIHVVPPSSRVLIQPRKHIVSRYWDFDPANQIRYRADAEYDEHFRAVFAKAVQRSLRSDGPVLAELSGGMDSSSIVCMADTVIARGAAECSRLDTLSWYDDSYDDSQPDFNEYPYVAKVEEKRRRTGHHINLGELSQREASVGSSSRPGFENERFAPTPIPSRRHTEFFKEYALKIASQGYRVVLSGLAGESATGGGVPTPTPELQDLLVRGRFFRVARQVKAWAAKMRKSQLPLLGEAARGLLPLVSIGVPKELRAAYWLNPDFIRRNQAALLGYPSRTKLFGPLPSFQNHLNAIKGERMLMAYLDLQPEILCERRYPYLDRDLREFICAIPYEQLVGVGQRRCMMRRALVGIVPDELLNRKRKRFVPRGETRSLSTEWANLFEGHQHILGCSIGVLDAIGFRKALEKASCDKEVWSGKLERALVLESWLRHLRKERVLFNLTSEPGEQCALSSDTKNLQSPSPYEFS